MRSKDGGSYLIGASFGARGRGSLLKFKLRSKFASLHELRGIAMPYLIGYPQLAGSVPGQDFLLPMQIFFFGKLDIFLSASSNSL